MKKENKIANKRYGIAMDADEKELIDKAIKKHNGNLGKDDKKLTFNQLCRSSVVEKSLKILKAIEKGQ